MIFIHKISRQSFTPLPIWGDSAAFSSSGLKVKIVTTQWTVYTGEASHPVWSAQAACKTGKRWKRKVGTQEPSPASAGACVTWEVTRLSGPCFLICKVRGWSPFPLSPFLL